jgi:protocatechuate 3,4-dioxygenase beta subunit
MTRHSPSNLLPIAALALLLSGEVHTQGPGPGGLQQRTPPRAGATADDPKGTAILRGFVVAADNGQPIRRAQVRISSAEARESRLATTDAQGRFEARELLAGRYSITASKAGFVSLQYGQRRPSESGTPIDIRDAQVLDRLVIGLPRGSVISGRITDEFGEPIANAVVTAMRYGYAGGVRRIIRAGGQNTRDNTDDQGQFRLFGLSPGEYYVTAAFRAGGGEVTDPAQDTTGFAPTYYPGASSAAEAQRVSVGLGQELSNVSFALVATKLVRISGTVMDSNGAPPSGGAVMLVPAEGGSAGPGMFQMGGGRIEASGRFRITNVAPGRYILQARTGRDGGAPGGRPNEFARQAISVGTEDLDGITLITSAGATVSGRVLTDTGAPPSVQPREISVGARAVDLDAAPMPGGQGNARVNDDWSFQLTGLIDSRLIRVNAPQGWALESVMIGGEDVTDAPIPLSPGQRVTGVQVVLTDKLTDVSGMVADARGQPVLDAAVVIFPSDDRLWTPQSRFVRVARPDQGGRYQIRGLPAHAGYLAVAVQELEDGQAGDPEFLASVRAAGTALSLNKGETKALDLRLR